MPRGFQQQVVPLWREGPVHFATLSAFSSPVRAPPIRHADNIRLVEGPAWIDEIKRFLEEKSCIPILSQQTLIKQ